MPVRRRSYSRKRFPRRRSGPVRRTARRRTATRRTARAVRGRSACVCPGELTPASKFALAQLDPFHSMVAGAKVPDTNTQPSISSTDIEQVTLLSSGLSTDLFGMAFRPQYTWGTVTATPGASLGWGAFYVTNSLNRTKRNPYAAAIELTRPVAHAIRLSSPLAPTSASGFVHIAISTETTFGAGTWGYPTTIAQISGCQFYKRVTLASLTQSPLTVINKWIDDTGFRYSSPTADISSGTGNGFQTDYAWGAIVIILEGVPIGVNVLSTEHLLTSEGIPQKDGPIIGTPAAASSPGTLQATSDMQAHTEPFHTEAEQEGYIQRGVNAFAQGAAEQGDRLYQRVGVPLLNAVGQQATSSALNMFYNAITGTGGISGVNSNPNRLAN